MSRAGPTGNGRAPLIGRRANKPPASLKKPRDAASDTEAGGAADETAEEQVQFMLI